jgi:hypothetical protein
MVRTPGEAQTSLNRFCAASPMSTVRGPITIAKLATSERLPGLPPGLFSAKGLYRAAGLCRVVTFG